MLAEFVSEDIHDLPSGPDFEEFEEFTEEEAFLELSTRSLRWRRFWRRRTLARACRSCILFSLLLYLFVALLLALAAQINAYPGNVSRWWGGNNKNDFSLCSRFSFNGWDGTEMSGCRASIGKGPPRAPLIFFHGNMGELTHASVQATELFWPIYGSHSTHDTHHFNASLPELEVITSSYRGFDPNPALWSSQHTIVRDAVALLDNVLQSVVGNQSGRVLVAGWSLGAAVAVQLTEQRPESVAGLLLVSPFASGPDMALHMLGYLITPWLWVGDQWNSAAAAASMPDDIPVAVVSAQEDTVIPKAQHRRVFDSFRSQKKFWLSVPSARHGDIAREAEFAKSGIDVWLKMSCARL